MKNFLIIELDNISPRFYLVNSEVISGSGKYNARLLSFLLNQKIGNNQRSTNLFLKEIYHEHCYL